MDIAKLLLQYFTQGGDAAIIVLLLVICGLLIYDRKNLVNSLEKSQHLIIESKDKESSSIKEIITKYHEGQLTIVQALNEIKLVLITIQGKV